MLAFRLAAGVVIALLVAMIGVVLALASLGVGVRRWTKEMAK
jgi:hypothetical protein